MVMVCISVQLPEPATPPLVEHLASFDFINQVYEIDGSPVNVEDNIDSPNITANGLEIAQNATSKSIIGDLLARLVTGEWVVVIEWTRLAGTAPANLLIIDDNDLQENFIEIRVTTLGPGSQNVRANDGDTTPFQEGTRFAGEFVPVPGLTIGSNHRIAVRRVDESIARSLNGSANENNSDASGSGSPLIVHFSTPMAVAAIGNYHGVSGTTAPFYMRSLDVYHVDAFGESDLPGFSS